MPLLPGERYITPPTNFPLLGLPPLVDPLARDASHLTLASNNLYMPFNGYSSGTSQTTCYRVRCVSPADKDVYGLRLGYANQSISASGEVLPADPFTITKAAVEYNGVIYPVFFDGVRAAGVEPGAIRFSDPVGVYIPKGSVYYVRNFVTAPTLGQKWPVNRALVVANGEGYTNSDFVDGAVPGTLFAASAFSPSIILGETRGPKQFQYALIGSSSAFGQGDTAEGPNFDYGYLSRVMTNKLAHVKLTRASDTIAQFLAGNKYRLAHMASAGVTHVLFQSGSNDISNGGSVSVVQDRLKQAWDMFHGVGLKVVQSTFTPVTTGTWADLAGQTVPASSSVRMAVNDWIRTEQESGKLGIVDPAIVVEDPTDRSKWRSDGGQWTADGTHLTQYGHQQVAARLSILDLMK